MCRRECVCVYNSSGACSVGVLECFVFCLFVFVCLCVCVWAHSHAFAATFTNAAEHEHTHSLKFTCLLLGTLYYIKFILLTKFN